MLFILVLRSYLISSLFITGYIFGMENDWKSVGENILKLDENSSEYPYSYFNISAKNIFDNENTNRSKILIEEMNKKLKTLTKEYHPDKSPDDVNNQKFAREVFKKIMKMRATLLDDIKRGHISRGNTKVESKSSTYFENSFNETWKEQMSDAFWKKLSEVIPDNHQKFYNNSIIKKYLKRWENLIELKSFDNIKKFLILSDNLNLLKNFFANEIKKETLNDIEKKLNELDNGNKIFASFNDVKTAIEKYVSEKVKNPLQSRKELDKKLHIFYERIKNIIKSEYKKTFVDYWALGYSDINNYSNDFKEVLNINWTLFTYFTQSVNELKNKQKKSIEELIESKKLKEMHLEVLSVENKKEIEEIKKEIEEIEKKIEEIKMTPITEPITTYGSKKCNLLVILKEKDAQLKESILNSWKKWGYRFGLGSAILGGAYLINKYFNTPRGTVKTKMQKT